MTTFCNNLKKGDRVYDTGSKRFGIVAKDPGEKKRSTPVLFDGKVRARRLDVAQLRFDPNRDGKPEDVAPFDGELQEPARRPEASTMPGQGDAVALLRAQREAAVDEKDRLSRRFTELRQFVERCDAALKILEAPAPA